MKFDTVQFLSYLKKRWRYVFWWVKTPGRQLYAIIDHQKKFIYFPIQRVAHTSVMTLIAKNMDLDWKEGATVFELDFPVLRAMDPSDFADYYKFCIVRNPYERLASCYLRSLDPVPGRSDGWFQDGVMRELLAYNDRPHLPAFRAGMPFHEFVYAIAHIPDPFADPHFRSQASFALSERGELLPEHFVEFQKVDSEIARIGTLLGWREVNLPQSIPSIQSKEPWQNLFSDRTIELCRQRYRKDFKLFNYDLKFPDQA